MQSVAHAQLLRAKQVCELMQISRSTMYSWLQVGGRYHNPLFPRPIYLSNGRTPFWRLADLTEFFSVTGAESPVRSEGAAVASSLEASEAIAPILKTAAADDHALPEVPRRAAVFKEVTLKGGRTALMRLRPHAAEIDPGRLSV
jgi:predicted DNA-binding transcriptional regulator AlpA